MKQALKIIGFTLFNVIIILLAVEMVFRVFVPVHPVESMGWFWRVPDPITGWSLEPGAEGRSYNDFYEYDVAVKVNSRGLRSPNPSVTKNRKASIAFWCWAIRSSKAFKSNWKRHSASN